jgi:hypothetical protein
MIVRFVDIVGIDDSLFRFTFHKFNYMLGLPFFVQEIENLEQK